MGKTILIVDLFLRRIFAHRTMNEDGTPAVSGQLDIHNASFAIDLLLQKYYRMFKKQSAKVFSGPPHA